MDGIKSVDALASKEIHVADSTATWQAFQSKQKNEKKRKYEEPATDEIDQKDLDNNAVNSNAEGESEDNDKNRTDSDEDGGPDTANVHKKVNIIDVAINALREKQLQKKKLNNPKKQKTTDKNQWKRVVNSLTRKVYYINKITGEKVTKLN